MSRAPHPARQPAARVTIAVYFSPADALLARMRLESSGIECFLLDENICRLYAMAAPAIGGIKLQVAERDAPRAADLLGSAPGMPFLVEPAE